jgi:hypothetical protein
MSAEEYDLIDAKERLIYKGEFFDINLYEKRKGNKIYRIQRGKEFTVALVSDLPLYTLEEQQEEAIVELLSMMVANKLDATKDSRIISLLRKLLGEIKLYVLELINLKEVEISKLPDNLTVDDLANLLAYSNSKLILPGYEVIYTTPDGKKFKTYQEASNHISELAKDAKEVDLSKIESNIEKPDLGGKDDNLLAEFIKTNLQYELTRDIIETWKKENNIVYDPEEVYSRGQEFVHIHNAYYKVDTNLWLQNLINILEDNDKIKFKTELSFTTTPAGELMKGMDVGIKPSQAIYIKAYPKPEDIAFASRIDILSSSFGATGDLLRAFTNKSREITGITFTKSVSLGSLDTIEPNLAKIVEDVAHHNELVIALTKNNFRIFYGEDVPYETKRLIDKVNKILDERYGKINEPEINKNVAKKTVYEVIDPLGEKVASFDNKEDAKAFVRRNQGEYGYSYVGEEYTIKESEKPIGKQPSQTRENLKVSIEDVKNRLLKESNKKRYTKQAEINIQLAALKEAARKYPRSLIASEVRPIRRVDYKSSQELFEENLLFQKQPLEKTIPQGAKLLAPDILTQQESEDKNLVETFELEGSELQENIENLFPISTKELVNLLSSKISDFEFSRNINNKSPEEKLDIIAIKAAINNGLGIREGVNEFFGKSRYLGPGIYRFKFSYSGQKGIKIEDGGLSYINIKDDTLYNSVNNRINSYVKNIEGFNKLVDEEGYFVLLNAYGHEDAANSFSSEFTKELIDSKKIKFIDTESGKECNSPGGPAPQAAAGMAIGGITLGGEWEIVKEFVGPSHAKGGINITVGENGVRITKQDDSEFKAKYGLVIPATDFDLYLEKTGGKTLQEETQQPVIKNATSKQSSKSATSDKTTRQLWEEETGLPWSVAKEEGLTSGSYEDNMKLRHYLSNKNYSQYDMAKIAPRVGTRVYQDKDGSTWEESYKMAWAERDGIYYAFPTIFQNEDGTWVDSPNPLEEAIKRGEAIPFTDKHDAAIFAAGAYKKYSDHLKRYFKSLKN